MLFDDFHVGESLRIARLTMTESSIIDFALHFDSQAFHHERRRRKSPSTAVSLPAGFTRSP